MAISDRFKNAWNAFRNKDPTKVNYNQDGGYYRNPSKVRLTRGNDRTIITPLFNRIALDVAAVDIKHCRVDENGQYLADIDSTLNECLVTEANVDQTGRAMMFDAVLSMLDEGVVAIVPTHADTNPDISGSVKIYELRVGKIVKWFPSSVQILVYNEDTGRKEEVMFMKKDVAIIENPLAAIVNEPNSTLQRLIRKLSLLDITDENTASNKLDLIIQLPYNVKAPARREQAERRVKDLEMQLSGSKYGIAYSDSTEKIVQLNRSIENNLLKQVEYWNGMVHSQLGMSQGVMDGTADEKEMLNYNNRTIEPILSAIVEEMRRKFLSKTARTQGQTIRYFRSPFKLVPVANVAEIADKFTRNEIMSSNEFRQVLGMKPSSDPKADQLVNSNINQASEENQNGNDYSDMDPSLAPYMAEFDSFDSKLDELEGML